MHADVQIAAGRVALPGDLDVPERARGVVVFAHGTGSSRLSPRNRAVAEHLRSSGAFGTLLFDLLTPDEDLTYGNRFDIELLADRLVSASEALGEVPRVGELPIGYFGASTGAAAAIRAAVALPARVEAVVSRGGRPDLAGEALAHLRAPTLLVVGGDDTQVIALNRSAFAQIPAAEKALEIVPGATHLFEEPGALDEVARLTLAWFERYLAVPA